MAKKTPPMVAWLRGRQQRRLLGFFSTGGVKGVKRVGGACGVCVAGAIQPFAVMEW